LLSVGIAKIDTFFKTPKNILTFLRIKQQEVPSRVPPVLNTIYSI